MRPLFQKAATYISVLFLCLYAILAIATRLPQFWEKSNRSQAIFSAGLITIAIVALGAFAYRNVRKSPTPKSAGWKIIILALLGSAILVASQLLPIQPPPANHADRLEIRALATSNPKSSGKQIHIVSIKTGGKMVDLSKLRAGEGWKFEDGSWLFLGDRPSSLVYESAKSFGESVKITLDRQATGGEVLVEWGNSRQEIDLYAPETSVASIALQLEHPLYILAAFYLIDWIAFGLGFALLFLAIYQDHRRTLAEAKQLSLNARQTILRLALIQTAVWGWLLLFAILASFIYNLPWVHDLPDAAEWSKAMWWLVMPYTAPK